MGPAPADKIKDIIRYHSYAAMIAGLDAEWTRKHDRPGTRQNDLVSRFQNVFDEFDGIVGELRAGLDAGTPEQEEALRHLYKPVHSLPVGHADALTLVLLDDIDPVHEITAKCSTTIEELGVAFCPQVTSLVEELRASDAERPKTDPKKFYSELGLRSLCEPHEMVQLCGDENTKPPLVMFMRFKLNGWGALGFGLLFEAALFRAITRCIVETMDRLHREVEAMGNPALSEFKIELEDLKRTHFSLLDMQGQEELAIWSKSTNFSIPMAALSRIHSLTMGEVIKEDITGELRRGLLNADWFEKIRAFADDMESPLQYSNKEPAEARREDLLSRLGTSHVFRWTRTTLGVSRKGFADPGSVRITGYLHAMSVLQVATGHQHAVDRDLGKLGEEFQSAKPQCPGNEFEMRLHAMGQGDLFLHHAGYRVHSPDMLVPTVEFFRRVKQTMEHFAFDNRSGGRRDLVGLSSIGGVPVPKLITNGEDFFCPDVSPEHISILENILPALRWRIAPSDSKQASNGRIRKGRQLTAMAGGLSLERLRKSTRIYKLPLSLIHSLEFLFQNYATLLANPFVFDTVLDLYDAFATLHKNLTEVLVPDKGDSRIARLHYAKVDALAKFVGTLHRALEHRLYRAYPEEHHRDMDVDFRGGLNEILFAADGVQKCAVGVLRNCVLSGCKDRRSSVGVVMRIGFQPGIWAVKFRLSPERTRPREMQAATPSARLAIISTDVPHMHHVPSYLDFLHEAFHLIYEELRDPSKDRSENRNPRPLDILPTVVRGSVLDERLGEVFVHFLTTLLVCRDEPELLAQHYIIQYSASSWTGTAEEPLTVRHFIELASSAYVTCRVIKALQHSDSEEPWWATADSGLLEERLVQKEGGAKLSEIWEEFSTFLTKVVAPLFSEWNQYWGVAGQRKIEMDEVTRGLFCDYYRVVGPFLPQLVKSVHEVFLNYQENTRRPDPDGKRIGLITAADWKRMEQLADDFIIQHGKNGCPLPLGLWRSACKSDDSLLVVCRYLAHITKSRVERLAPDSTKGKHLPLDREGNPSFTQINKRENFEKFLIRPGCNALWCLDPTLRRERLLQHICALKGFWDVSTALRANRLGEMMAANMTEPIP